MHILIVEDDLMFNHYYAAFFAAKGAHVINSMSLEQARLQLGEISVLDAVLLDNQLTDGEGLQLVPEIIAAFPTTAMLMVSANDSPAFFMEAYAAGLDDYAVKPVNMDLLWVKLCRAVEMRRLTSVAAKQQAELEYWIEQEQQEQQLAAHVLSTLAHRLQQHPTFIQLINKPSSAFSGDLLLHQTGADGTIYVLLADAMGHGLAAAISLMPVLEVFQAMAAKALPLSNLVFELNNKLNKQLPPDRFVAAILIRIVPQQQRIEVWNGAMPPLLIANTQHQTLQQMSSKHMALGILDERMLDVTIERLQFDEHCHVIGFTDGLTDTLFPHYDTLRAEQIGQFWLDDASQAFATIETITNSVAVGADDIAIMWLDLKQLCLVERPSMQQTQSHQGHVELNYHICGTALAHSDTAIKVLQTLGDYGMSQSLSNDLFAVLTELYLNAFEHGILKLDSAIKNGENGFFTYYEMKEQAIGQLKKSDYVFLSVTWDMEASSVVIKMKDSGNGFNFQKITPQNDTHLHGRGLQMIAKLCTELTYKGSGNEVEAVING